MGDIVARNDVPWLGDTPTTDDPAESHDRLMAAARATSDEVLRNLGTRTEGLSAAEAAARGRRVGTNDIVRERPPSSAARLLDNVKNPLVLLLVVLGALSYVAGDHKATAVIAAMVVLGVALRFVQERRGDHAAEALKSLVANTATVFRDGQEQEAPLTALVPGDIVRLAAGDMVPADVRILSAKDLFVNQAALTGEPLPVERHASPAPTGAVSPLDLTSLCFLGSNVESGSATAVVLRTGRRTYFGSLAASATAPRQRTSFDRGIRSFVWLMIRLIAVMVPAVFLINGLSTHHWVEAFLFAMAVAVGLTPEMLPMIVTVNLSKGALVMARKKVIVKRLNAIQDFGAMDVLCTDKTGTLTEGRIVLERHMDVYGDPSDKVLHYGYLNSFHQTGLRNLLDLAILQHEELRTHLKADEQYRKIDEIPFDFVRRRMSVVVEDGTGLNTLICKGAVDEVMALCTHVEVKGEIVEVLPDHDATRRQLADTLNSQGFRVIALAYKQMPDAPDEPVYAIADETNLVLLGFMAFLDPPNATAAEALKRLRSLHVEVKVLTGDNELVASYICREVGMPVDRLLLGSQVETMGDAELADAAREASVFARLIPSHKERIIRALQQSDHVLGFLGDGINDAPALKAADVGISVSGAVDIAKESSDIILLEHSLLVLEQGVLEGRRVFGNIVKYVKMAASSNFGNVLSVVGASAFLPFLPMLPIQILANNLLYDFSQTAIPTDHVDAAWLTRPRRWAMERVWRFVVCIGPISSVFDYLTFLLMLRVFDAWNAPALFRTGWFVESLCTQTLIIHIIRTDRVPFLESHASWPLIGTSVAIIAVGIWLPVSPLGGAMGFVPLPWTFWPVLVAMMLGYATLTQLVKAWFVKRYGG